MVKKILQCMDKIKNYRKNKYFNASKKDIERAEEVLKTWKKKK